MSFKTRFQNVYGYVALVLRIRFHKACVPWYILKGGVYIIFMGRREPFVVLQVNF